jgi:hypothetical protein
MPYKSTAQVGKLHAMADRGEISKSVVHEFDEATKRKKGGFASLPARVKKKKKRRV